MASYEAQILSCSIDWCLAASLLLYVLAQVPVTDVVYVHVLSLHLGALRACHAEHPSHCLLLTLCGYWLVRCLPSVKLMNGQR